MARAVDARIPAGDQPNGSSGERELQSLPASRDLGLHGGGAQILTREYRTDHVDIRLIAQDDVAPFEGREGPARHLLCSNSVNIREPLGKLFANLENEEKRSDIIYAPCSLVLHSF